MQAGMWVSNWFGLDRALTRTKSPSVRPETDRAMQDLDRLGANLDSGSREGRPGPVWIVTSRPTAQDSDWQRSSRYQHSSSSCC